MPTHVIADRVQETTTTTGTGTISLAGAAAQCQTFLAAVGDGNECDYVLLSGDGSNWETGTTYVHTGSPATLTRDKVLASTNSGAAISLTGTSTVFLAPTARQLYGRFGRRPTRPAASALTWLNQGSAFATDWAGGPLSLTVPVPTSGANNVRGLGAAPPTAPWTLTAELEYLTWSTGGSAVNIFVEDSTGKLVVMGMLASGTLNIWHYSSVTAVASTPKSIASSIIPSKLWLRIYHDGSNLNFQTSCNGADWVTVYTETATTYLGTTLSLAGFAGDVYSSATPAATVITCWSLELKAGTGSNVQWV